MQNRTNIHLRSFDEHCCIGASLCIYLDQRFAQNISYEISDSGDKITFIDEGNAEQFRSCPGCSGPGDPCGCELFDVTIVSEGPSLVRVDLYGEYDDLMGF